jgi:ethanolamine ammonia-lyase small subunit
MSKAFAATRAPAELPDLIRSIRERTPARVFSGRAGPAYRTATQLELRRDHAAAVDSVHAEVDLLGGLGVEFVQKWGLFEAHTLARSKAEYLLRPDLGRRLDDPGRAEVVRRCAREMDLQLAIGDGLSAAAVRTQVPALLPLLVRSVMERGLGWGQPFFIRHCRVGVLNDIGELLSPAVVVLLIGERPGLATDESLSAYLAYRPQGGHTDAQRNLISNIHARGVSPESAAARILDLVRKMCDLQTSGVGVKEDVPSPHGVFRSLRLE